MNPFATLQLDEPPLRLTPDDLLSQARNVVRRRRLVSAASGAGLAVGAVAVAVPLLSEDRPTPAAVLTASPTTTPAAQDFDSVASRVVATVRATGHELTDVDRSNKGSLVLTVDGTSVVVAWGTMTGARLSCDTDPAHLKACETSTLPDGADLLLMTPFTGTHGKNVALLYADDGTVVSVQSYDEAKSSASTAPAHIAFTLDELRTLLPKLQEDVTG